MADGGASLLPLLVWLSPAFPVGAYAYSHGLEWAVEAGDVADAASLAAWLDGIVLEGAGRNDAILLAEAHRAASAGDLPRLEAANALALAFAASAELRLETAQQGRSFLEAVAATWPHPVLSGLAAEPGPMAYPVALGAAAAVHRVPVEDAVRGQLAAFAGNLVSAAIRLAPIGQTAGQAVLARLVHRIEEVVGGFLACGPEDLDNPHLRADLGSFLHETQYTRLFRS